MCVFFFLFFDSFVDLFNNFVLFVFFLHFIWKGYQKIKLWKNHIKILSYQNCSFHFCFSYYDYFGNINSPCRSRINDLYENLRSIYIKAEDKWYEFLIKGGKFFIHCAKHCVFFANVLCFRSVPMFICTILYFSFHVLYVLSATLWWHRIVPNNWVPKHKRTLLWYYRQYICPMVID